MVFAGIRAPAPALWVLCGLVFEPVERSKLGECLLAIQYSGSVGMATRDGIN